MFTSEIEVGESHVERFATVPNIARGENDDPINLGFVGLYKLNSIGGKTHETLVSIRAYRYDSTGLVQSSDNLDNHIKRNQLDRALQQENYEPDHLDAKISAIELDLDQLKTFQEMYHTRKTLPDIEA